MSRAGRFAKTLILILPGALFLSCAPGAAGCPIPVFRYALEFWEPDPYRITVFHSGPLDESEQVLAAALKEASTGKPAANIDVRLVEAGQEGGGRRHHLYEWVSGKSLPLMVLQYPYIEGIEEPLWSGPFDARNIDAVLRSPARERISARLAEGVKVWVLLEGGDRRKDSEALDVLERELARLAETLELPDPELWWTGRESSERPEVRFEILILQRDDPAERHLVNMLLKSEADLEKFGAEPMVFPVYGRGIALWAIVGKGINAWTITDAAEFLTGPCSCQVKMLNPGVDLLIEKDWASAVMRISDEMLTPATGFAGFEARGEEAARRLEESDRPGDAPKVQYLDVFGETPSEDAPGERGGFRLLPALLGAAAALAAGALILKFTGKKLR